MEYISYICLRILAKAHEVGDLYYHDLDSYNLTINCLHIPTKEILEKDLILDMEQISRLKE